MFFKPQLLESIGCNYGMLNVTTNRRKEKVMVVMATSVKDPILSILGSAGPDIKR